MWNLFKRSDKLIDFYLNEKEVSDFTINRIIDNWGYASFEHKHDYIQWLFPLSEKSKFNANAPIFTKYHWKQFRKNPKLTEKAERVFERILEFYGFFEVYDIILVGEKVNPSLLIPRNHNLLRITRILRSLRLMDFQDKSEAFFCALVNAHNWEVETLKYWGEATFGPIKL